MRAGMELLESAVGTDQARVADEISRDYEGDAMLRKAAYTGAYMVAHSQWDPRTDTYAFGLEVRNFFDRQAHDVTYVRLNTTFHFDAAAVFARVKGVGAVERLRRKNPGAALQILMGAMSGAASEGNVGDYCAYDVTRAQDQHTEAPTGKTAENLTQALERVYEMGLAHRLEGGVEGILKKAVEAGPMAGDHMRKALKSGVHSGAFMLILNGILLPGDLKTRDLSAS